MQGAVGAVDLLPSTPPPGLRVWFVGTVGLQHLGRLQCQMRACGEELGLFECGLERAQSRQMGRGKVGKEAGHDHHEREVMEGVRGSSKSRVQDASSPPGKQFC